jgi:hypothetical protein
MAPPEARIVIALQPGPAAPSGRVQVAGEPDRSFTGWLGLLSALEAAIGPSAGPIAREEERATHRST